MSDARRYNLGLLSALLRYPDLELTGLARSIAQGATGADAVHPASAAFAAAAAGMDLMDIQAEYVRTFDLDPKSSLYPIWHAYGDSPRQGRALAALLEIYRDAGFSPQAGELPDYLPMMLEFTAEAPDWAGTCVWEKFGANIATLAQRLDDAGSLYAPLLQAAAHYVAGGFNTTPAPLPPEE